MILLAACILLALSSSRAIDMTGHCVAGPESGACAQLSPVVWENDTYTSVNASTTLGLFTTNRPFLSEACIASGLPFLCAEAYKPCMTVVYTDALGNNFTVGVPARPCKSLCLEANSSCYAILSSFNLLYLVQCNATDADGQLYPTNSTTYVVSETDRTTMDVMCNDQSNLTTSGNVTCASELFVPLHYSPPAPGARPVTNYNVTELLWDLIPQYRDQCAIRCPNPQYGDDYWRSISIVWFVVCLLSMLCSLFSVVTFILYPERRKFPSILILHLTVACLISAFSGLLTLFDHGDVKRLLCVNEYQYASFGQPGLCTAQALVFILGNQAILWWWFANALNMVALIVFRLNLQKYYWLIVCFGWGPPVVFVFVALGTRDVHAGVSWPFCTPASDSMLYYPIGVLSSLGFLCSVLTVGWIMFVTIRSTSEAKWQPLIAPVVRTVLFGLIASIPYATVFAYRFSNDVSRQFKRVGEFVLCIIQNQSFCGTVPRVSPAFNYALSISLASLGILIWVCFSTHLIYFTDFRNWVHRRLSGRTAGGSTSNIANFTPSSETF